MVVLAPQTTAAGRYAAATCWQEAHLLALVCLLLPSFAAAPSQCTPAPSRPSRLVRLRHPVIDGQPWAAGGVGVDAVDEGVGDDCCHPNELHHQDDDAVPVRAGGMLEGRGV